MFYPILTDRYVADFVESRRRSAARFGTEESRTLRLFARANARLHGARAARPTATATASREAGAAEGTPVALPR